MPPAPGAEATIAAILAEPASRPPSPRDREHDRTVEDIVTLTEIPSPPFAEAARAGAYLAMLPRAGLEEVEQDGIGNVMGRRRGTGNGATIVVAAHLDTVFPAGTDVRVRREGTKLFAPGVGDDTRSLAVQPRLAARHGRRRHPHPRRYPVRRRCRRGRPGRPARHAAPVPEGPSQGPDQRLLHRGQPRHGPHRHRRRRLQALSRHLQGPRRPQLRRLRPGQSDATPWRTRSPDSGRVWRRPPTRRPPIAPASPAAAPRSTRSPTRYGWSSTCARSRAAELARLEAELPRPGGEVGRGRECRALDPERRDHDRRS